MAFAVPIAAAIGSTLLGNKLSKAKPNTQEQQVLAQNAEAQKVGLNAGKQLLPQGQSMLQMGQGTQQQPINYWSSLLSGNRGMATAAAAPEISRISQGYQTAANTSAALNPRGGPTAEFNAELPYAQQRDTTSLLQRARPEAATNLFNAGQSQMGSGQALLSNAINAIYGSTSAGRDILNTQQNLRQTEAERGKSMGSGLFDIFQKYGGQVFDKIFKNPGSAAVTGNMDTGRG